MAQVRMYTTRWCGYCVRAKALLDGRGIPYEEIDLADDPSFRERLDEPADPDRRPADRRLHRALAPRPRGPARRAARRVGPPERLAAGAVPGTAPGNADLVDRRAAPLARLPAAAVHLELVLRFAASAVRPAVVAQRRALAADPRAERLADALVHR